MTDQELQQLAREYAEQNPPADIKDEVLKSNMIGLNAEIFEKFLIWLTKTHCLVSREKVMQQYHDDKAAYDRNSGDGDYFEGYWGGRVDVYEDVFGAELFETNKPTEQ